jgi:hypothetical protein
MDRNIGKVVTQARRAFHVLTESFVLGCPLDERLVGILLRLDGKGAWNK